MAVEIPWDVPSNPFTRAGILTMDGAMFDQNMKIGTPVLCREIECVKANVTEGTLQTRSEWEQVRNITLLWCFSLRTPPDNKAMNALFRYIGLADVSVPGDVTSRVFRIIEAKFDQSRPHSFPTPAWISRRSPPQRLPTPSSLLPPSQDYEQPIPLLTIKTTTTDIQPDQIEPPQSLVQTPRSSLGFNANPKFHGKYDFTDHRQEYDGYQFQCIFKCLKDGKHCRKAPVREMNRHLRSRHNFRPGFKIAGVDWEKKRWRGAGADHEECVGKIVEKDAADESENDEPDLEYTMEAV